MGSNDLGICSVRVLCLMLLRASSHRIEDIFLYLYRFFWPRYICQTVRMKASVTVNDPSPVCRRQASVRKHT